MASSCTLELPFLSLSLFTLYSSLLSLSVIRYYVQQQLRGGKGLFQLMLLGHRLLLRVIGAGTQEKNLKQKPWKSPVPVNL